MLKHHHHNHCQCDHCRSTWHHDQNHCKCEYYQSNRSDVSDVSLLPLPEPAIISGFIPANGQNPVKSSGDFAVRKSEDKKGVYSVLYNPPFAALPPGTNNPVMVQAYLPLVSNRGFRSNTDNTFAFVVTANVRGFKYITFEFINDHVIQRDLDADFTSMGLYNSPIPPM
jgi:hypothetical protein